MMTLCRGEPWRRSVSTRPALCILCKAVMLALALATPVYAADIAVDESCSLFDAITAANADEAVGGCPAGDGADVITLSADVTLAAELPRISSKITVEGGGFSISGNSAYRIFYVEENGTLRATRLTMQNGRSGPEAAPDLWQGDGGAIYNEGNLDISDSVLSENALHLAAGIQQRTSEGQP